MQLIHIDRLKELVELHEQRIAEIGYGRKCWHVGVHPDGYLVLYKKGGKRRPWIELGRLPLEADGVGSRLPAGV